MLGLPIPARGGLSARLRLHGVVEAQDVLVEILRQGDDLHVRGNVETRKARHALAQLHVLVRKLEALARQELGKPGVGPVDVDDRAAAADGARGLDLFGREQLSDPLAAGVRVDAAEKTHFAPAAHDPGHTDGEKARIGGANADGAPRQSGIEESLDLFQAGAQRTVVGGLNGADDIIDFARVCGP